VDPIIFPLSKQDTFISNSQRLGQVSQPMYDAFWALRHAADGHSDLSERERELIFVAAFAATKNEGGFRVHVNRAHKIGVTIEQLEQVVLLLLSTSLGLAPTVELLVWLHDELD